MEDDELDGVDDMYLELTSLHRHRGRFSVAAVWALVGGGLLGWVEGVWRDVLERRRSGNGFHEGLWFFRSIPREIGSMRGEARDTKIDLISEKIDGNKDFQFIPS